VAEEMGITASGYQKMIYTGLTSDRLKEIKNKILYLCREKVDPEMYLQRR